MRYQLTGKAGFAVVAVLLAISILAGASATLLLLNSYKAQHAAREFAARVELDAIDQDLKRSAANSALAALQGSAGTGNVTLPSLVSQTGGAMALATGAKDAQAKFSSFAATISGRVGNLLTVAAWTPTATGYTTVTPPAGVFSHRRGSIVGKEMQFNVGRSASLLNNLEAASGTRTPDSGGFRMKIYEIPSQSWAASGNSIQINTVPQLASAGSVVARNLALSGASVYYALVTDDMTWTAGSSIGGRQLSQAKTAVSAGQKLAKDLERGAFGSVISPDRASVFRGGETAVIAELGDHGTTTDGTTQIPNMLLPKTTPTDWDAYCMPFYQTSMRISGRANAAKDAIENVTITVHNTATLADRRGAAIATYNVGTLAVGGVSNNGLSAVRNSQQRVLLRIDPASLPGGTAARAIYADIRDSSGSRAGPNAGVLLSQIPDISPLGGFSIVTPNALALEGRINTVNPVPMSVMAREILFGNAHNTRVTHNGQMARWATGASADIAQLKNDRPGGAPTQRTLTWSDITDPLRVPPVTTKQWIVVAE